MSGLLGGLANLMMRASALLLLVASAAVLMVACEEAATPTSTASAPAQPSAQPSAPAAPNPPGAPSAPTNPPAAPETPGGGGGFPAGGGGGGFPASPGGTVPAGTVVSNIVFELLPDGAPAGSLSRSESKIALPALDGYRTESIALTGSVITSRFPAGFAYTWEDSRKRHLWKRDQDAPAITSAWLANGGTVVVSYSLDGNQTWHDRLDGQGSYFHAVHSWGRADGAAESDPGFVRLRLYRESSNAAHPVLGFATNSFSQRFSDSITHPWAHNCKTSTVPEYTYHRDVRGSGIGNGLPIDIRNSINGPVVATAEAVLFNGQIIRIQNLNPATYTSASLVVTFPAFSPSWPTTNQESQPGSGATFGAVTTTEGDKVAKVVVVSGGSKYHSSTVPTFSAAPDGGTTATGTATITDGVVTAITVTNKGSGYTRPPKVTLSWTWTRAAGTATISNGAVTGVTITNGGGPYTYPPRVSFPSPSSGTKATGTATINGNGAVTGVTITSGGSGYTYEPSVGFGLVGGPHPETKAVVAATFGSVIDVTTGGSGYRQNCSFINAGGPDSYLPADHVDLTVAGFWPTAIVKESIRSIAETSNNSILVRFAIISPSSTQPPVPVGS